jgi:hypothetical protein
MKRIASILVRGIILAGTMASFANAQTATQEQPLGDYARAVRKDKKPPTAKQFDNDNLPAGDKINVVGGAGAAGDSQPAAVGDSQAGAASGEQSQTAANGGQDAGPSDKKASDKPAGIKPGESPEDRQKTYDAWKEKIAAQRAKIDTLSKEVEQEQREYQLRQSAAYADIGNRLRASGGWEKDDADYKKMIDEKKKAADEAKQRLEDMQEDARKAGVPASVRE